MDNTAKFSFFIVIITNGKKVVQDIKYQNNLSLKYFQIVHYCFIRYSLKEAKSLLIGTLSFFPRMNS